VQEDRKKGHKLRGNMVQIAMNPSSATPLVSNSQKSKI